VIPRWKPTPAKNEPPKVNKVLKLLGDFRPLARQVLYHTVRGIFGATYPNERNQEMDLPTPLIAWLAIGLIAAIVAALGSNAYIHRRGGTPSR
jgi:hypothetical protein